MKFLRTIHFWNALSMLIDGFLHVGAYKPSALLSLSLDVYLKLSFDMSTIILSSPMNLKHSRKMIVDGKRP